jgi:Arc/MetJ-type ribon-helix-helix transcriptional regulator
MTITLPEAITERVTALARKHGFSSPTDYLVRLVEEAEAEADVDVDDGAGPPELGPRNREELERMLDEGMASGPPIRVTPEFWEERKRVLAERMAKRKGGSP